MHFIIQHISLNIILQWINGNKIMEHQIGHLPFEKEINSVVKFGEENHLTVAVDNTLSQDSVPQGYVDDIPT